MVESVRHSSHGTLHFVSYVLVPRLGKRQHGLAKSARGEDVRELLPEFDADRHGLDEAARP